MPRNAIVIEKHISIYFPSGKEAKVREKIVLEVIGYIEEVRLKKCEVKGDRNVKFVALHTKDGRPIAVWGKGKSCKLDIKLEARDVDRIEEIKEELRDLEEAEKDGRG